MKLKHAMTLSLLAVAAMVPVATTIIIATDHNVKRFDALNSDIIPGVIALSSAKTAMMQITGAVRGLTIADTPEMAEHAPQHRRVLEASQTDLAQQCAKYEAVTTDPIDAPLHAEIERTLARFSRSVSTVLSSLNERSGSSAPDDDEMQAAQEGLQVALDSALKMEMEELRTARAQAVEGARRQVTLGTWTAAGTFGLALGMCWVLARSVARGVPRLIELADRFGRGELTASIEVRGANEFVQLGTSMRQMAASLAESRAATESAREAADSAREAAEAASIVKGEFLANMSHEIRTPMTAILGYAELLDERTQTPEARTDCVRTIRRNGEHLLQIINDILDLSKIEFGKMAMDPAPCSLCGLVTEVAALMRVRAIAKGLQLRVQYIFPVPERVYTDALRVRQVLINLIGNAIKFTEIGEVTMVVRFADPEGPKSRINIDVTDSGIGIDSEQVSRLFKPFSQGDSSMTRRFGGTGLGLTISQRLAERLGGALTVRSQPGRGSVFTFTFDVGTLEGVRMIQQPEEAVADAEPQSAIETKSVSGRILLVEDGPDNQRLIAFLLRKAGADVDVAEDGAVGLEAVRAAAAAGKPFDLIFMDMQMPRMDGHEATRAIRALGMTVPIVALTAHAMTGDREKCLASGCTEFLSKPTPRAALIAMCARFLKANPLQAAA